MSTVPNIEVLDPDGNVLATIQSTFNPIMREALDEMDTLRFQLPFNDPAVDHLVQPNLLRIQRPGYPVKVFRVMKRREVRE